LVSSALVVATISANAQIVTLTDNNATAVVDTGSQAGMNFWSVDGNGIGGQNQLMQQWFWYRVDGGLQHSIDTIGTANNTHTTANTLTTTYTSPNLFSISIMYTLVGSGFGSGQSDIQEGIQIHNFTTTSLNISFYQYSHFTLLGENFGNTVTMDNASAYQQNGQTGIAESIVAPDASAFEANTNGGTGSTLYKLNNNPGLVLSGTSGTQTASGDVTWSFQWDFSVPGSGTQDITKDKLLNISFVPEPSALGLAAVGYAVFALRRRWSVKKG
jgi:hypothetical protein